MTSPNKLYLVCTAPKGFLVCLRCLYPIIVLIVNKWLTTSPTLQTQAVNFSKTAAIWTHNRAHRCSHMLGSSHMLFHIETFSQLLSHLSALNSPLLPPFCPPLDAALCQKSPSHSLPPCIYPPILPTASRFPLLPPPRWPHPLSSLHRHAVWRVSEACAAGTFPHPCTGHGSSAGLPDCSLFLALASVYFLISPASH